MVDDAKKAANGGAFLLQNIAFQETFIPEDFTNEHKDIAKAVEDFIKGEIISRGDEIEMLILSCNHR